MNGIIMDDITNHKLEPYVKVHYTDLLALSKLFCIIGDYPSIQKQIQEIWPSIKTCSRITNDMTLDECLKAFDINIEESEEMKSEWETDVTAALKRLEEEEDNE